MPEEPGADHRRAGASRRAPGRTSGRGAPGLALDNDQDRLLGVGARLLHAGGVARSLCWHPGRVRELPRLRRRGARLRSPQPAGAPVAASRGPRNPPALARGRAACPSTDTISTSSPTTARRLAGPTVALSGGRRFERWIFEQFLGSSAADARRARTDARAWCAGSAPAAAECQGSSSASSTISTRTSCGATSRRRTSRTASG